jgi:hypothetical protein
MNDALVNFIYALVIGKSIKGTINDKRLKKHIWEDEYSFNYYVSLMTDSFKFIHLINAALGHKTRKKGNAE